VMPAGARLQGSETGRWRYDSDSFWIAVNNCCSRCITNSMADFVEPPKKVWMKVRGIGGEVLASFQGTVKWSIADNKGKVHTFTIPNAYYHANSPYRLWSPQHLSQIAKDNVPRKRGTWCGR
jgi:hypothetical protein